MSDHKQLKFLILMAYYNRPILVKNAMRSLVEANKKHQNWHLLFGDDGSLIPGKPIVQEVLGSLANKASFLESNLTFENKLKDGLVIGQYANQVLKETDSDVAIILCDDDELHPDYLFNLNKYFQENPDILYCYSKIILYNPLLENSNQNTNLSNKYNQFNNPINPVGKLDASQVAWRLDCCKKYGAWFPESTKKLDEKPLVQDTDRGLFENLFRCCGLCHPTDFVSQYKGVHDYQLLWHKNNSIQSLEAYDRMCRTLAGVKF